MKSFTKRFLSMVVLLAVLCTSFPMGIATSIAATDITFVSGSSLSIDADGYMVGIDAGTAVSAVLSQFDSSSEMRFVDNDGNDLSATDIIGTGSKA